MIQNEEIARLWRKEKEAWDSKDIDGIIEAIQGSCGYGFRGRDWRGSSYHTEENLRPLADKWLISMEYLRHEDEVLNTWSDDEVGIAWGSYTEEFKHVGMPPERVKIRFTSTYRRDGEIWALMMTHKDAQQFTPDGTYVKDIS